MSLETGLSHFLLRLALHLAPPAHREAVLAMESELEHCERGRLAWALGSLGAALRWRVGADWLYAAMLVLAPILAQFASFALWLAAIDARPLPADLAENVFRAVYLAISFLAALALGWYRPRTAITTALSGPLVSIFYAPVLLYLQKGVPIRLWSGPDATQFMGLSTLDLCLCIAPWLLGSLWGARRRRAAARA